MKPGSGVVGDAVNPGRRGAVLAERIPVYRPDLSGNEEAYVLDCLRSSWISSKGEYLTRFETAFREFIGAHHATSVCNGTVAIQIALAALGIGPGDEVIVPSFTYIASVNTIVAVGATPVFAEIDPDTWQMDPVAVERLITPRTRAIIAVHLYGNICDMVSIMRIANHHCLVVVEDCAESFGATIGGRHAGTFGDAATFSFFGNKTITTGEGGMVVCRDEAVAARAFAYKTQGVSPTRTYWHETLGFNFRMTNIAAALGLAQIERATATIASKRALAVRYRARLAGLPLRFYETAPGVVDCAWMVSVVLDDAARRDPVRAVLDQAGIETRPFFHPAHLLPMYQRQGLVLPVSERIAAAGLNLPSWPGLGDETLDVICDVMRGALGQG